MKTYQITWIGTIQKTVEINATSEDDAIEKFNNSEGKIINYITTNDDIEKIKEIKQWIF